MAVFSNLILTDTAKDELAKSLSDGTEIQFTKFAISQHAYSDTEISSMTAVQEITGQAEVSDIICNDNTVTVSGLVQSSETAGYYLQTAALYARTGETEFLYAVSIAQLADYIPAPVNGRYTSIALSFVMKISDTSIIDLTVSPTAAVTQEQFAIVQKLSHTHDNKSVLDSITAVDTALSSTSTNPVQNKALCSASGVGKLINYLTTGTATPEDDDYYVCQSAGGGTTRTTYHRKPVSALWEYIKNKISSILGLTASTYGGKAATATKLATARTINGSSFDGSSDITVPIRSCYAYDDSSTFADTPWHKFATITIDGTNANRTAVFYVNNTYNRNGCWGILRASIRVNSPAGIVGSKSFSWGPIGDGMSVSNSGSLLLNNFYMTTHNNTPDGKIKVNLWVKITTQYDAWQFVLLSESSRTKSLTSSWTLIDSSSGLADFTDGNSSTMSPSPSIAKPVYTPTKYLYFTDVGSCIEVSRTGLMSLMGTTDSGWVTMENSSLITSGTIQYRTFGNQLFIRGDSVVLKSQLSVSSNAPQSLASTTRSFANAKCKGVAVVKGTSSPTQGHSALLEAVKYSSDNILSAFAIGSSIPPGATLDFMISGFIN